MKRTLTFLILISSFHFAAAQDLVGRKIINGNLNAQITSFGKNRGSNTVLNSSILYGKIKDDNTYWAFGANFSIAPNSS